jgi:hypothetical protein
MKKMTLAKALLAAALFATYAFGTLTGNPDNNNGSCTSGDGKKTCTGCALACWASSNNCGCVKPTIQ